MVEMITVGSLSVLLLKNVYMINDLVVPGYM